MNHWICRDLSLRFHGYPDVPSDSDVHDMLEKAYQTLEDMRDKVEEYPNYVRSKKGDLEVYINAVVMNLPDALFAFILYYIQKFETNWSDLEAVRYFFDKKTILSVTFPMVKEVCLEIFKAFEIEVDTENNDVCLMGEIGSTIKTKDLHMTGKICDFSPMPLVLDEILDRIEEG